jgi:diketogulonate reductase-like aldo/keto reductase
MGSLVYSPLSGGWLTGRWRKGTPGTPTSAARPGARFDMSTPPNERKLDVVEELAQLAEKSGLTMIELALAWAINHPAVTSVIIGPRAMEQLESQLPAVHVTLSTEILDRIDELVAPGVTLIADDNSHGAAELTPQARRLGVFRRPPDETRGAVAAALDAGYRRDLRGNAYADVPR